MYNTQINTIHALKFGFNLRFNYNLNWLWFWLSAPLNVISFMLEPLGNQRSCGSIQFSSVTQSCLTLSDPVDYRMPGFPVHHQLPELAQIHVHHVSDAFQPSYPLLSPSPLTFNLFQHQGLFQWVSSSHQVAKILKFQLQHQSFQWMFRTDFL